MVVSVNAALIFIPLDDSVCFPAGLVITYGHSFNNILTWRRHDSP